MRATVTGQGEMVSKDAYFPFGKRIEGLSVNTSDPQDRYKYNGKELDRENDLNWLVPPRRDARYYDPELGRWHVVDPAREYYSNYVYVQNNSINDKDKDGRVGGKLEMLAYMNAAKESGDYYKWTNNQINAQNTIAPFVIAPVAVAFGAVYAPSIYGAGLMLWNWSTPYAISTGTFFVNMAYRGISAYLANPTLFNNAATNGLYNAFSTSFSGGSTTDVLFAGIIGAFTGPLTDKFMPPNFQNYSLYHGLKSGGTNFVTQEAINIVHGRSFGNINGKTLIGATVMGVTSKESVKGNRYLSNQEGSTLKTHLEGFFSTILNLFSDSGSSK